MPATRTRLQLKTRARYLADATEDANIDETDLDDALNDLIAELHGKVFDVDPDRLLVASPYSLATTQGTRSYDLPEDFIAIRRVDFVDGDNRVPLVDAAALLEMDFSDNSSGWGGASQYRVMSSGPAGDEVQLWLTPDPGTETYEIYYVLGPPVLSADDDVLDVGIAWQRYITQGLAAEIRERQETDSSPHRREQQLALDDVLRQARKRDAGRARRPIDVRWGTTNMRRRVPPWPST
jgi:hypothetical protein